ncbi:hypothetical protein OXX80_001391 [Metschnikowia pulcherrima]
MSGALEQSLDSIIGENAGPRRREHAGRREHPGRRPRGGRGGAFRRPAGGRPHHDRGIPEQILKSAEGRAMLRLKNIHPDLNGMDLSDLFLNIAPVDFVKFDPRDETIAYVCFQSNFNENNTSAIQKFDGKKAMGNTLIVENATSLADRIAPIATPAYRGSRDSVRGRDSHRARETSRPREAHRVKAKQQRERKPRPAQKSAEDLDNELAAYMSGSTESQENAGAFAAQDNGEAMLE